MYVILIESAGFPPQSVLMKIFFFSFPPPQLGTLVQTVRENAVIISLTSSAEQMVMIVMIAKVVLVLQVYLGLSYCNTGAPSTHLYYLVTATISLPPPLHGKKRNERNLEEKGNLD